MSKKKLLKEQINKCNRRLLTQYRSSAKKRKIPFELDLIDIVNLTSANCAYCGSGPSNKLKYLGIRYPYNGIDRKDSKRGYVVGNVLTSCKFCNGLKGRAKWATWADFINRVAANHGGLEPFPEVELQSERKGSWKGW